MPLCLSNYFLIPVSNMIPNKRKHSKLKVLLSEAGQCSSVSACQKDTGTTWQSKEDMMRQYDSGVNHNHASKVPSNVHLGMAVHCELQNKSFKLMEAHIIFVHVLLKWWLGMCKPTKTSAKCDVICICSSSDFLKRKPLQIHLCYHVKNCYLKHDRKSCL